MTDNHYRPDTVSPPGETLAEMLEERGVSQAQAAKALGLARKTVHEIIHGKAPITAETALRLERVLRVPAEFWCQREASYRLGLARKTGRKLTGLRRLRAA
jgi:HTH-type transcriptional regulator/antitoxin HigA